MPSDLAQWITPVIFILGVLYLDRSIRSMCGELMDFRDHVDRQIGTLRDRLDNQTGDLRDRLGRIEGTLDVLRDFLVRNGRGTAA